MAERTVKKERAVLVLLLERNWVNWRAWSAVWEAVSRKLASFR